MMENSFQNCFNVNFNQNIFNTIKSIWANKQQKNNDSFFQYVSLNDDIQYFTKSFSRIE